MFAIGSTPSIIDGIDTNLDVLDTKSMVSHGSLSGGTWSAVIQILKIQNNLLNLHQPSQKRSSVQLSVLESWEVKFRAHGRQLGSTGPAMPQL